MWFLFSKKEMKKEIKKLEDKIHNLEAKQEAEKERIANLDNKLTSQISKLEGEVFMITNFMNKSQSQKSIRQVSDSFETRMIQRIKKSKRLIAEQEIKKLLNSMSILEILEKVVYEKHLCSRASFYRYLSSIKSQKLSEIETLKQ